MGDAVSDAGDAIGNFASDPLRGVSTLLNPLSTVLPDSVNQAIGMGGNFVEPGLGTLYGATSAGANGGDFGTIAKDAAISLGTQGAGSELGYEFPDSLGGTFGTGGGSLTDALGQTSNAGSLSNYYDDFSNLFTNPLSGGDFGGVGGTDTGSDLVNSARDASSAAASTPSLLSPDIGASTPSGVATAGGGGTGGFVGQADNGASDISGGAGGFTSPIGSSGSDQLGSADNYLNSTPDSIGNLYGNPNASNGLSSPFGPGDTTQLGSANSYLNSTPAGGNKVATSGNNMLSGLLKAGLGGLFTNTNQSGYNGENAAAQQAAAAYQPFLANGTQASNTLANLYGNNGTAAQQAAQANFQNTPGYQFQLNQGIAAQDASAAAKGQLLGGNQEKALTDYGQGLAGTQYQQYVNNLQNQANQGSQAATGYGNSLYTGANALAQGGAAQANNQNQAIGGALSSLFPTATTSIADLLKGNYNGGGNNGGALSALSSLFSS